MGKCAGSFGLMLTCPTDMMGVVLVIVVRLSSLSRKISISIDSIGFIWIAMNMKPAWVLSLAAEN